MHYNYLSVPTAPVQTNRVTTSTSEQQEATTQKRITTAPIEQGQITAPTEQDVFESHECYDDLKCKDTCVCVCHIKFIVGIIK